MSGELEPGTPNLDELFDAWQLAWEGRDAAANTATLQRICTADVQYEDPLTPEPLHGAGTIAHHGARLRHAFPDVRVEQLGARLGNGRMAAAPCRVTGTHTGQLGTIPASGQALSLQLVFYCELQGGRIHRARAFFDVYGAAVQLGVLPGHGSLGERAMMVVRGFGWRR